jgi:DNA-binding transcriptional LysR family regulator
LRPFANSEQGLRISELTLQAGVPTIVAMELYQLKTFVAVAQEGHLTRAAERVFTSPPAVSAQIKALEDELGVRLFDRTPRGMGLTEEGRRLLDEAERTLASAGRMRSTAAQLRGAAQGVVRFGTVSDPMALRLGDALLRLAQRNPQVTLQLQQGLSSEMLHALQRGELDCAYVMTDHEEMAGLQIQRLAPVDLVVALPTAFAQAHPDPSLADLMTQPWIGTPAGCVLRTHIDALFAAGGREYQEGASASTEGVVRSMVASGMGVGVVRLDQAEQAERQGELRIWKHWRAHTWICFASPPESRLSPATVAVRAAVQEAWS